MPKQAAKALRKQLLRVQISSRGKINVENLNVGGDVTAARYSGFHGLPLVNAVRGKTFWVSRRTDGGKGSGERILG